MPPIHSFYRLDKLVLTLILMKSPPNALKKTC